LINKKIQNRDIQNESILSSRIKKFSGQAIAHNHQHINVKYKPFNKNTCIFNPYFQAALSLEKGLLIGINQKMNINVANTFYIFRNKLCMDSF
jgi:hypothetical protein